MKPANVFLVLLTAVLAGSSVALMSQETIALDLPIPTVTSATDGIFTAFQTHSLVGIGDYHRMAQEEDFYAALIRDPRFAKDIGNVVVEFGDAAQQGTIDRYVAGEDVPYDQLRKVWTDTVGWIPTVIAMGYIDFFAQIRDVNLTLPSTQRIHVWLGDPPVDWSKVNTRADFSGLANRDQYPAELIRTELLAKGKKALVIYGTFHFYGKTSLRALVEQRYPNTFFVVTPYTGFNDRSCSEAFERTVASWPHVALATPVRGTLLQNQMHAQGCHFVNASAFRFPASFTESQKAKEIADMENESSGVAGDALLYLGPAASLTYSPMSPDIYIDFEFRREINRRSLLLGGRPISWPNVTDNPMSPSYIRSYEGQVKVDKK